MKTPSNLPPGCTSDDGGIDHAFESALDRLCAEVQTHEEAEALIQFLPILRAFRMDFEDFETPTVREAQ